MKFLDKNSYFSKNQFSCLKGKSKSNAFIICFLPPVALSPLLYPCAFYLYLQGLGYSTSECDIIVSFQDSGLPYVSKVFNILYIYICILYYFIFVITNLIMFLLLIILGLLIGQCIRMSCVQLSSVD